MVDGGGSEGSWLKGGLEEGKEDQGYGEAAGCKIAAPVWAEE